MALLPVADAQARLLTDVTPTEVEWVDIHEAGGRTLAADLPALRTQPPTALSAMDGYALRFADATAFDSFRLIGESAAGHGFDGTVGPGETVRIFTGAPMPAGGDTVVMQEFARRDGQTVRFAAGAIEPNRHVRQAGLDFRAGDIGLTAGTRLGIGQIALAAAMNHARLPLRRRPRVAILATGDELVPPGTADTDNRIVASNSIAIAQMVREAGGTALDLGIAPDDLATIRARIRAGLDAGADIVCLIGGASVGDHDHTQPALVAEGMSIDFWKIAMRPGKPLLFGRLGPVQALGLPGNPVSSLVCGVLFLAPLIRARLGQRDPLPREEIARLGVDMPANDVRCDYVRATLADGPDGAVATPVRLQDSSLLSMVARAEALLIRPAEAPAAQTGDRVGIIRL